MRQLLRTHVKALQVLFKYSWIIFIPEGNLGHEAAHMSHALEGMGGKIYTLMERKFGQVGVHTSHEVKISAVEKFEYYLEARAVSYFREVIVVNPFLNAGTAKQVTQKKFENQLASFRKLIKMPLTPHGEVRLTFSGKTNHEGQQTGRMQDDLVMACILNRSVLTARAQSSVGMAF
jgi:hypothetical protein